MFLFCIGNVLGMVTWKKIGFIAHYLEKNHIQEVSEILHYLSERYSLEVKLNDILAKQFNSSSLIKIEDIDQLDAIFALGGDGTILWASRYSAHVPIFGINTGSLGFLTTSTLENALQNIDRIMADDFILEKCMRLQTKLDGKTLPTALNEAYITNKKIGHICSLSVSVDAFNLGSHLLDGVIVSTPVGSTAYALSAGGSIIEPKLKALHIVPVNNLKRRFRPFVTPGDSKITVKIGESSHAEVAIVIDGNIEGELKPDSIIEMTQAKQETIFIRFPDYGFFNRLSDKLGI